MIPHFSVNLLLIPKLAVFFLQSHPGIESEPRVLLDAH